jgi:hypothetical protein
MTTPSPYQPAVGDVIQVTVCGTLSRPDPTSDLWTMEINPVAKTQFPGMFLRGVAGIDIVLLKHIETPEEKIARLEAELAKYTDAPPATA